MFVHDLETKRKSTWRDSACVAEMISVPCRGSGDLTSGRHFSRVGFYSGSLDGIAIWNRALSATEIHLLSGERKGPGYSGLVHHER